MDNKVAFSGNPRAFDCSLFDYYRRKIQQRPKPIDCSAAGTYCWNCCDGSSVYLLNGKCQHFNGCSNCAGCNNRSECLSGNRFIAGYVRGGSDSGCGCPFSDRAAEYSSECPGPFCYSCYDDVAGLDSESNSGQQHVENSL